MQRIIVLVVAFTLLFVSFAHAKRCVATDVPSIYRSNIEYRVPHAQMGCVEAWQGKTLLWRRQIYVVKYIVGLERDVQDVFIKTIELKGNVLIVTNERQSEYEVDVDTLQVKVLKGALLEKCN